MKNLLFIVESDKNWMGGVYYIRNIIFALLQVKDIEKKYKIYILLEKGLGSVFEDMADDKKIFKIYRDKNRFRIRNILIKIINKILHIDIIPGLRGIIKRYKIDLIYPMNHFKSYWFKMGICWIPDFQHIYYPDFFSEVEIKRRDKHYKMLAKKHKKLVLSSQSAYSDYKKLFPLYGDNIYVIPFVSAIPKKMLDLDNTSEIKNKYGITQRYFLVSNQFWQHKNHMVVFRAVSIVKKVYKKDILVVCTGLMSDYRNPGYCNMIEKYIEDDKLDENIKILGLIDREDQIQLMKGCLAVIQPSLFEGWGTVVEDAKTLCKPVVMSDIPVHFEQRIEGHIIYKKEDHEELAKILIDIMEGENVNIRSDYSYIKTARKYGELFCDMLGS